MEEIRLPLQPLTAEAAKHLHRLGSPELEEEAEAAALAAMLTAEPPPQHQQHPPGPADDASASDPQLAQLSEAFEPLQPDGGDAAMAEADSQGQLSEGSDAEALPGSPQQAAAAASAEWAPEEEQRRQQRDPLISHRVEEDCAAPIQMLSLEALSRNPLLQQFQLQRAAAARAEQTARAVAAATALNKADGFSRPEHDEDEVADGMLI